MKIAFVGPSPVPFTIGGIENLMWGLVDTINQKTEHQCEIIKLPSREFAFWDLIETYYSFYMLDLSHFDAVIYNKYPGWMVRHPRGICYISHCLRGLYDTYFMTNLPYDVPRGNPDVDRVLDYMEEHYCPEDLDEFFELVFTMKKHVIPQEYCGFPGPFIRKLVWYMDRWGLNQNKTVGYYCVSQTVRNRLDYFPEFQEVTVVNHPSMLSKYTCKDYKYVFMVSRLDAPKRIDMLIRAMKYVTSDVRLLIAGRGPEKERLEELAKGDSRIEFLGFVNDDDLEDYYADSLVIPYFPYDEDYGLITIEAMLHKKPVITTIDAGGPTEFVFNNETGYVVDFEEHAIAEKIDYFARNPQEAKRMGENAYQTVKRITWESTAKSILECLENPNKQKRKKIVVTSPFGITPPRGGGQARIYNIYKNIAKEYDVDILSLTGYGNSRMDAYIAGGMKEIRTPISEEHYQAEALLQKEMGSVPISDIALLENIDKTMEFSHTLENRMKECCLVFISHPYQYYIVKKYLGDIPFIYEAQDVEYHIKKGILSKGETSDRLLQLIYEAEKRCCIESAGIMTCSDEDRMKLNELYGVSADKILVVPNGVDTSQTGFVDIERRIDNKKAAGLEDTKIGLFMGSWHGPNLEACERIFEMAEECPETIFLLMGSQCTYFNRNRDNYHIPENVGMLGIVSDQEKLKIFNVVDFALNPMLSGSGTNLKMFDYMSAGIPVITTPFGTRGIQNKNGLIQAEIETMPKIINEFSLQEQRNLIDTARHTVEEEFDWQVIVKPLLDQIHQILDTRDKE